MAGRVKNKNKDMAGDLDAEADAVATYSDVQKISGSDPQGTAFKKATLALQKKCAPYASQSAKAGV